jgi:hypothetical protein
MRFEITTTAFERAKRVDALYSAATETGRKQSALKNKYVVFNYSSAELVTYFC